MERNELVAGSESMKVESKQRLDHLDVARGIAMCCVVLGHLGIWKVNRVVFTFHLPIFYFISGYFLNTKASWGIFLRKKVKSLLVPYFFTCMVTIILSVFFAWLKGSSIVEAARTSVFASAYAAGDRWTNPFPIEPIGMIWFLWATFWGLLLLRWLITKDWKMRMAVVSVLFALSVWSWKHVFWFPLSVQAGGCALLFMYLGWLYRQLAPQFHRMSEEIRYTLALLLICVWIWCIINFKAFWLVHCSMTHGLVDVVGSIGGCIVLLAFSRLISQGTRFCRGYFAFMGRYSLIVLCIHKLENSFFPYRAFLERFLGAGILHDRLMVYVIPLKLLLISVLAFLLTCSGRFKRLMGYGG